MTAEPADGSSYRDDLKRIEESADGSNYRNDDASEEDEPADGSNYRDGSEGISWSSTAPTIRVPPA